MSKPKLRFKNDKFKKSRGGASRMLDISCAKCGEHLCFYQKDGAGALKRLYLDRINPSINTNNFECNNCKEVIGVKYIYEKENRLAYRLFVGSVTKNIMK